MNSGPGRVSGGAGRPAQRSAELEAEIAAWKGQVRHLNLILDNATDYAIVTLDLAGQVTYWNAGAGEITGYIAADVLGRSGELLLTSEDRRDGRFAADLTKAFEEGRAANERHVRRDGRRFWASGMLMALQGPDGRPEGFVSIFADRTAARADLERRELVMGEMNHRIKNTFAVVQAIATQIGRHAATVDEFKQAFGERLRALARSHETLMRSNWQDTSLREVIEGALSAYAGHPGRIEIDGGPVLLPPSLVVMLTLALHELAMNAAKHGSLSVPGGRVRVTWATAASGTGGSRVETFWQERSGPRVRQPHHRGFGTQLIQRMLGSQAGFSIRQDFRPEGLECRICFPTGNVP